MNDGNAVYYRLYRDADDEPCVVEMQWFDEMDYDQGRFWNEERYESEAAALAALRSALFTLVAQIVAHGAPTTETRAMARKALALR